MAERRYTMVFFVAVLVAAAATFGVYKVLETTKASSRVVTVPVIVAMRDIPEGHSIDRTAISASQWPAQTVPAGAFASVDSVVGRVTRVPVFRGEPLVPGRLAPAGTGPGLEVKITPGKRAMAVRINDVAGISGLIQPNARVDVLVTLREEGGSRDQQVAKLFMENMRVLSVGDKVQRGDDGESSDAKTATLEVTPDEAERLAVAVNQGSIALVLRGYGDPDSINTRGATSSDVLTQLRGGRPIELERPRAPAPAPTRRSAPPPTKTVVVQAPPPPKRPDSSTVQVYRAGKMSQQKFEKPDSIPPS
ncbi:MAG: Flp pilus assembly protein CpaB [Gemmatimonadaceae bacterium]